MNDIYNQDVVEAHYTFDLEPMTMEARREWFTHYSETGRHRLLVAVSEGRVIDYACSSRFRPTPAYETSVETSVYLAPDAIGRGAGALRDARGRGRPPGVCGNRPAKFGRY